MTEELPPLWALDMAVTAAEHSDWHTWLAVDKSGASLYRQSIIAHARTLERLAKREPDIVPVDDDLATAREICGHVAKEWARQEMTDRYRAGDFDNDPEIQFALAALRRRTK
jgi:hypothetical protein